MKRSSGILLPVFSLPSPYGIGTFGKEAYRWVEDLYYSKQSYWQILPLGPTGYGDSPYQSFSAFAGNPYFIDLDTLCEDGLLKRKNFIDINWGSSDGRVDYDALYSHREGVLRKAFSRFEDEKALDDFREQNFWFEDYGLFMAIKKAQGQRSWLEWDEPLRLREPGAISLVKEELADDIRYHAFVQYQFQKQWQALKKDANEKEVEIIGDIPIYVSLDSADVWANPEMFQLDENSVPREISGCPPDGFSEGGQVWGNPLYDWALMAETGFEWWIKRLRYNFELYDVVRIDHFRGFEGYFAIPYGAETAGGGHWENGPGLAFIESVKKALPDARIIAENLGFLTDGVNELLEASGYMGMKIVQFAFDSRSSENDGPDTYTENTAVYTGTHDNDTVKGWSRTAPPASVKNAMKYFKIWSKNRLPAAMINLAMGSKASLVVIPMQEWLELGNEARINTPSTLGGNNWRWRLTQKLLQPWIFGSMATMTKFYLRTEVEPEVKKRRFL